MKKVEFDFDRIPDLETFYSEFKESFDIGDHFGANLDALWDAVTGGIELPVEISFIHFSSQKRVYFAALVLLFEEAEEELEGELQFNIVG
ncbi:barstar family protein [Xenorhabdus bovienii]|uniref:Barstar family protein n=1 Tax=Xenorhabdus bovienii TaxID=40576 RepID=A0AAJ1J6J4_XENBV|nr:barstar family protein [Xenorhabdus bovienii]MDE1477127.1 barstar family protein [Xenorhabdus bovienii]MDE1489415.1 barstar family protein [Xenorhabdus bovienii]MDE1495415.1 barstar family protein [Xenorhabdus bovienii]MDE9442829.1 barstar family protein [Xenorhabdus bovienii]MDE9472038.1 barstar family protein [Xenorhabdus bovienii]